LPAPEEEMNNRIVSVKAICKRKLFEALISPGAYIALAAGLVAAFVLVTGFVDSIGSSGFNREQAHPVYVFLMGMLDSLFGPSFNAELFAEGPYLFALVAASVPLLLYLAFGSVYKFGFEKNVGAIELITYGPADGTSYFLASLLKDVILCAGGIIVLLLFFALSAILSNLVLGPSFFYALAGIFFLALSVFSLGILSSVVTENAAGATALFAVVTCVFAAIQAGSYSIAGGYVKSLSDILGWIVGWFSPLRYWSLGLDSVDYGNGPGALLFLLAQVLLAAAFLAASHFILKRKGVRA
jgi:hypothetical protein